MTGAGRLSLGPGGSELAAVVGARSEAVGEKRSRDHLLLLTCTTYY